MKTDKLTKSLLAIIAFNLSLITLSMLDLIPKAQANNGLDESAAMYGLVPINEDGSVNVRLISSDEIDVNISDISTYDELNVTLKEIETSDILEVNIEEVGGYRTYGKLDVDCD